MRKRKTEEGQATQFRVRFRYQVANYLYPLSTIGAPAFLYFSRSREFMHGAYAEPHAERLSNASSAGIPQTIVSVSETPTEPASVQERLMENWSIRNPEIFDTLITNKEPGADSETKKRILEGFEQYLKREPKAARSKRDRAQLKDLFHKFSRSPEFQRL